MEIIDVSVLVSERMLKRISGVELWWGQKGAR